MVAGHQNKRVPFEGTAACCSAQTTQSTRPGNNASSNHNNKNNDENEEKRRRVDNLVARFHADRLRVSGERGHDVAVVFVAPGTALDDQVIAAFRCASSERPFAPFDVAALHPTATTSTNILTAQPHCYVLRCLADNQSDHPPNRSMQQNQYYQQYAERCATFDPYYCIAGCPLRAVRHYRIDFDALLRLLFYNRYRYVLKPIVVDRCLTASQSSSCYFA